MPSVTDSPRTHWFLDEISMGLGDRMALDTPHRQMAHQVLETLLLRPEMVNPQWSLEGPIPGHYPGHSPACVDLPDGQVCFIGSLLRFASDGYSAVWRVHRYDHADCGTWHLIWPD